MDDLTMMTEPWTGENRRTTERRLATYEFGGTERRLGGERRTRIPIAAPSDPSLAVPDRDSLGGRSPWAVANGAGRGPGQEHDAIPSVAALGGHPLHPMLVPLPIGALAFTVLADVAYATTKDRFFARAGTALTTMGIASGLVAAGAGAIDFLGRSRIRDHRAAWVHAGGNVGAVGLSAASLALRLARPDRVPRAAMAASVAVGTMLLVTGWLGGELSYRHRIGVIRETGVEA